MKKGKTTIALCLILVIPGMAYSAGPEINKTKLPDEVRARQIQDLKWGMFICWSFSTFYKHEWTPTRDKDSSFFKATGCDTDQWCQTARDAGMGYILFLTKHHDGFCLWDTETTEKKVTNSPLGIDVLAKLRKSCDRYGIKLALYFSEGDWNWPGAVDGKAGKGGNNPRMKKAQLKELLTNYGPIEFLWMDHAVGTGGLSHKETVEWVHRFQPNTFVGFNHGEPAGRLCLREMGRPGKLGDRNATKYNKDAEASFTGYYVAEFTYPILPKHKGGAMWFYSLPKYDDLCHPASKLFRDYQGAVKYGNIFSINVGPNPAGRLRDIDVKTLKQVGEMIKGENSSQPGARLGGGRAEVKEIKAYCIDFNWGPGGPNGFARPGLWADADPARHVAWYKAMGANVIQTFCVSCNGYAWYKNGVVPEQPGLKHDFLPEMVRLGHEQGMLVMGYFCIGANTRWGQEHPDLSYGIPSACHIPFTDEYLDYLSAAIRDAVQKTGIDGFMIDWVWQPQRKSTSGRWLACEKKLYVQLMGEEFPSDGKLSRQQELAYSRKAIERCWKTIRKAAKEANPRCIIWLASNNPTHPHVVNSTMYREVDWLMNERGDLRHINAIKPMVGKHTRLIICLAKWNRQDPMTVVPQALKAGVGLYGFAKPRADSLLPLEQLLKRPVHQLRGDERNIAVLARAYHGVSINTVLNDEGEFVEPME